VLETALEQIWNRSSVLRPSERDAREDAAARARDTLQQPATHCNTPATHHNTLQHIATPSERDAREDTAARARDTLQQPATHCNTPQHIATPPARDACEEAAARARNGGGVAVGGGGLGGGRLEEELGRLAAQVCRVW